MKLPQQSSKKRKTRGSERQMNTPGAITKKIAAQKKPGRRKLRYSTSREVMELLNSELERVQRGNLGVQVRAGLVCELSKVLLSAIIGERTWRRMDELERELMQLRFK